MDLKVVNNVKECTALIAECLEKLQQKKSDNHNRNRNRNRKNRNRNSKPYTSEEYMTLHSAVYNLCSDSINGKDNALALYKAYRAAFGRHLSSSTAAMLQSHHLDDSEFLRELVRRWDSFQIMARVLSHLLIYIDRCYLSKRAVPPSLKDTSTICFKESVYDAVKGRASMAVASLMERDREGGGRGDFDNSAVVSIFVDMGMGGMHCYELDLEAVVVEETAKYYSCKAARWLEAGSCRKYLIRVEVALRREREVVERYLRQSSVGPVMEKVREVLLASHSTRVLEDGDFGLRALVRSGDTDGVRRIFRLYVEIPEKLIEAAELFRRLVADDGLEIIAGQISSTETVVIKKLMELHRRYSASYVKDCFDNHRLFRKALSSAFESFCNKSTGIVEPLAAFCEDLLKKGGLIEKLTGDRVEETLESVVQLLVYADDKDMFAQLHHKKLSRRLLFGSSADRDLEKSLVARLKRHFGGAYTSKLEGMLKDITVAEEDAARLRDGAGAALGGCSTSVTVLTTNFWPSYKPSDINLPPAMAKSVEAFTGFYKDKFGSRRLTFFYSLGTCNIQAAFKPRDFELVVSTHQALVLMLFNDNAALSLSEIKSALNMEEEEMVRVVQSLSSGKYKILHKAPTGQVFQANLKFNSPKRKISIPAPIVDNNDTGKKVKQEVDSDRIYAIDAAVVRIMKGRKVMNYPQIIGECVEMLKPKFKPTVSMIKKRVEDLIQREFLERDADVFRYLA